MDLLSFVGIAGMLMILVAFALVQSHKVDVDNLWYNALNFVGSAFLIVYAIPPLSWPFIILNTVWALIALKDLLFHKRKPKHPFLRWLHGLRK